MKLIDTHAHLYSTKFEHDCHESVQRAIEAGVERMYLPNVSSKTTDAMNAVVAAFPNHCFPMIGLHPCNVDALYQSEVDHVASELATGKYVAVGETGLDYYHDITFKKQQKDALRQQITLAKEFKLPIALHTRDSFDDSFDLIAEQNDETLTGVFHCFTGSTEDARKIQSLGGFYVGIGGVVTFKNSNLKNLLPEVPLDRIVLETDAPYLAPAPYRGKRNESAYLTEIAKCVAAIKEISVEELATRTSENALRLYKG